MTLRLNGSTSGYTEIDAPAVAGSNTIVLPSGNGSANQLLKNGSTAGTLGWSSMVETPTGVGIGTASPGSALSLGTNNQSTTDRACSIRLYDVGGINGNNYGFGFDGNAGGFYYTAGTGGFHAWLTANTERMRLNSAGAAFLNGGTSAVSGNPNDGLHVGSAGSHLGDGALTLGDSLASARWRIATGNSQVNFLQNNGSGTYLQRSYIASGTGSYVTVSDKRAKKFIDDFAYGINQLKKLRPVSYLMIDQDEITARRNLGFIAQEVKDVIPEAVITPEDTEEQFYGLEHTALIPVLTKALQEAVVKIEALETRIAALEVTP